MAEITPIQFLRGTAAQWTSANPTLAAGKPGFETDTKKLKIGDGSTAWNSLPYIGGSATVAFADLTGDPDDNAALVTYVATEINEAVTGLWDDRGNFDASVNAYPSSGGSGTAGAILKGDVWTVSVAGTLPTAQAVSPGDTVRALVDTPGNTQANWAINGAASGSTTPDASDTVKGKVELATPAEVITGTDTARAVTPEGVHGKVVGVQDLFIPASALWPRVTNGCSALTQSEVATSLFNIQTLDFDQTTQEFAQCQIALPRKWNNGTITAEVYWTASSGSGGVVFGLSGGAYSNDDALTVALGTAQTMTDTLLATNDLHITPASSAITLAGTPASADFLALQLSRNPSDGSDTLTGDAKVLGIMIHLTTTAAKDA